MALVKCKECGSEISTKAHACPRCGAKIVRTSGCAKLLAVIFGFFVLLLIIGGTLPHSSPSTSPTTPTAATTPGGLSPADRETIRIEDEQRGGAETIVAAEEAVRRRLKDPDSAQFRDVQYGDSKKTGPAAYGFVNSKNAFGGYPGFQRFVSNGSTTLLEEEPSDNVTEAWRNLIAREITVWPSVLDGPAVPVVIDVKTLIGKSETEVEKILGAPSSRRMERNEPELSYRNEKVAVVFINGKADWITVSELSNVPFTPAAIGAIGLAAKTPPSFGNSNVIRWEPYNRYRDVSIFPSNDGKVDYIYVRAFTK